MDQYRSLAMRGGRFFFAFFMSKMEYRKKAFTLDQHIDLLTSRGLIVSDKERTCRYLQSIGYYRLSAYFPPFQIENNFKDGCRFDDILKLYIFDRKLRQLAMDALERIEVAFRTVISNEMSFTHGPHWFLNNTLFKREFIDNNGYNNFINQIEYTTGKNNHINQNQACRHYYNTYTNPPYPPSWVVAEVFTMGNWSRIYKELKTKYQKRISNFFCFDKTDLESWIHALTLIRNNCAHHNRLWNHSLPPKAKNIETYTYAGIPLNRPYTQFALIQAFLKTYTHSPTWSKRLSILLNECPLDIHEHMEFPADWEKIGFWDIKE